MARVGLYRGPKPHKFCFFDANCYLWCWDRLEKRVYMDAAETEVEQNGYFAGSLEEAIELLTQQGYMEKDG